MTVHVRTLPWWELSEVAEADARIFGATAWTLEYYWAVAAQPGTAMLVARDEDSGALAGWVVMSAVGAEGDVMTIATTEAARGRGVGRTLLLAGIDWAVDAGAGLIHLEVAEGNAPAIGLYRSLGFEEWGRRPDYYPGADAVLMRRSAR
ncbi:GNAT family N-acetyltransferase [Brevibacterium sp. LS14]|uniref:GNAT family N-acetyltransferase n=1 Tax=Brevibacterium TaxID=1696 RepID=UPI0014321109|nr:GNAT family N-acetyltransferase [Brevibacterium sp. LS14]